jgi:hypothetical protein
LTRIKPTGVVCLFVGSATPDFAAAQQDLASRLRFATSARPMDGIEIDRGMSPHDAWIRASLERIDR